MRNWIADENRFSLKRPPKWWLKRLWDFDDSLVMIPSKQHPLYRLAQRREPDPRIHLVEAGLWHDSDTKMLASYHLVPVTSLRTPVNWENPLLFTELAERAPWRQGGAEKVIAKLEVADREATETRKARVHEMMTARSEDAWNLLRKRAGLGRTWHHQTSAEMSPRTS